MKDVMDLIFEYRRLLARRDVMGVELSDRGRARLAGLEKLFATEIAANDQTSRRRHARVDVNVPATLRVGGRIHPVNIVNVGGGGICIEAAPTLEPGQQAVLRIVSADGDRIYQYQVQASWTQATPAKNAAGMPFVGIPRELPVARAS